jgi:multiple sugar transport system permease protein
MTGQLESRSTPTPASDRSAMATIALLTPATLMLVGIFLIPIGIAIYFAFTNFALVGPKASEYEFTGLANFTRMVVDPVFIHSVGLTIALIVGCALVGETVIGLTLALLMQKSSSLVRISVSTIALVAWVIPEVTVAFAWYAFSQPGGPISVLLQRPDDSFLSKWPFLIISLANVWHTLAFSMLIFSAGLRNVPPQLLEVGAIEGASYWTRLRKITLPLMRPVLVTNWLIGIIQTLSVFTLIYVMTQGGPNNATMTLPVYIYQQAINYYALGYGCALALVLLLIGGAFGFIFVRNAGDER